MSNPDDTTQEGQRSLSAGDVLDILRNVGPEKLAIALAAYDSAVNAGTHILDALFNAYAAIQEQPQEGAIPGKELHVNDE